jgi:hypothetical protein
MALNCYRRLHYDYCTYKPKEKLTQVQRDSALQSPWLPNSNKAQTILLDSAGNQQALKAFGGPSWNMILILNPDKDSR